MLRKHTRRERIICVLCGFVLSGWFVVIVMTGLVIYAVRPRSVCLAYVLPALLWFGFLALVALHFFGARLPFLQSLAFWGGLNTLGKAGLLFAVVLFGGVTHGVGFGAAVAALIKILFSVLFTAQSLGRASRWFVSAGVVVLMGILVAVWFIPTKLENTVCQMPITNPSHASMMTGRYSPARGILNEHAGAVGAGYANSIDDPA